MKNATAVRTLLDWVVVQIRSQLTTHDDIGEPAKESWDTGFGVAGMDGSLRREEDSDMFTCGQSEEVGDGDRWKMRDTSIVTCCLAPWILRGLQVAGGYK